MQLDLRTRMQGERTQAVQLSVRRIAQSHVFPERAAGARAAVHHERQLESLERGKAPRRRIDGRPHEIRIAGTCAIEEPRRRDTAFDVKVQASSGFLRELLRPWNDKLRVERRIRCKR